MKEFKKKIYLIHGDCDYLIFKELKAIRTELKAKDVSINEMFGSKSLDFRSLQGALQSTDLFLSTSAIILRDIMDGKSFYPFVEKLTEYINSSPNIENLFFIVHYGKILKTSKIYKAITKLGEVQEFNQPKEAEILSVIHKSLNITNDGAQMLLAYTGGELFRLKNEIKKLESYAIAHKLEKLDEKAIEEVCIKSFAANEVWGIGSKYLRFKLAKEDQKPGMQLQLAKELDYVLANNTPAMQILYSFYQYILGAIKMKRMTAVGYGYRECMALGYFFVKEFFEARSQMNLEELFKFNEELLEIESQIKSGLIDELMGLRRLVVM